MFSAVSTSSSCTCRAPRTSRAPSCPSALGKRSDWTNRSWCIARTGTAARAPGRRRSSRSSATRRCSTSRAGSPSGGAAACRCCGRRATENGASGASGALSTQWLSRRALADAPRTSNDDLVRAAFRIVLEPQHLRRTLTIAVVVGTVLTAINQADVIARGDATATTLVKAVLNYVVPFIVSNLGLLVGTRDERSPQ